MAAKIGLNSSWYKDALEHTSAYNARLCFERKQRSPFLDAQTGVAQVNCHLWKSKLARRPPAYPYQLYSYPGRRWKKRPRQVVSEQETAPSSEQAVNTSEIPINSQTVLNPETSSNVEEDTIEVGTGEGSEENSDEESEFEEEPAPRRPGRPGRPPKKTVPPSTANFSNFKLSKINPSSLKIRNFTKEELAKMSYEDRQKPYVCEICGKRYKNGPGLKYHYTHYNHDQDGSASETAEVNPVNPPMSSLLPGSPFDPTSAVSSMVASEPAKEATSNSAITPNDYCDFCLGDVNENKKTLLSEELLSCADCGRSGHPTCLQFTMKLTNNVKKYRWQCIECKSCTLCGTSDNDDQLLFCDDCDRGYHMYCLKPPMETPPEGSWVCKLCEDETN